MANEDSKKKYQHYFKQASNNPNVLNETKRILINSIDQLDYILNIENKDAKYISYDCETTGLDPTAPDAEIVGYSFAFNAHTGYYVPVAHAMGTNLGVEALQMIYEKFHKVQKVFVFNLIFDFNYLEYEGQRKGYDWNLSDISYYDLAVGIYLLDTNKKFPSLKWSAKYFLGWDLDTFEETLGTAYNFKYLAPEDAYTYAAFDAIMTYALVPISLKGYQEAKLSGKIDNEFLYPLMYMLKGTIQHDIPLVTQWNKELQERHDYLEKEIYKLVGLPFKINSPKQLSDALLSIGFDTGVRSKSGYMKAGMDELAAQNKITPNPIVELLVEYKKIEKTLSTYIRPYLEQYEKCGSDRWRYCYHLYSAPTCRLSGGKDGKNTYYSGVNVHAISKPHSKMWYVHDYKPGDERKEGDIVVLDWRFSLVDPSDYLAEAFDPQYNLRSIYKPNEHNYWVSIDFSAEELRLIANYSKAKIWTNAFLNGEDLHANMAKQMFGEENYNHDLRKRAKGMNFGGIYGLSPYSVANNFGLSVEEGQELYDKFWAAIPEVTAFQRRTIMNAKKTGTVYNYFGRPRRVKHWLTSPDRKDVGFGERTCKNSPIQSAGADIMKLAMIKIYRKILTNPKYKGHVQFMSTIHDEVNLSIDYSDRELFMEIFTEFYNCMYCKFKGWEVPFEAGIEIGETWGGSFTFEWNADKTRLEPVVEYKPRVQEVKVEAVDVEVKNVKINSDDDFSFDLDF